MNIVFDKDEYVVYEARRHWFMFFSEMFLITLFFLLPFIINILISKFSFDFNIVGHSFSILIFFYSLWILGLWLISVIFWTDYYLDVLIITNKRVIDIEQKGLFRRDVSYFELSKVQDIKYEVNGIIATLLNFGDLHIQTAGQQGEFVIKFLKSPNFTREKLDQAVKNLKENTQ